MHNYLLTSTSLRPDWSWDARRLRDISEERERSKFAECDDYRDKLRESHEFQSFVSQLIHVTPTPRVLQVKETARLIRRISKRAKMPIYLEAKERFRRKWEISGGKGRKELATRPMWSIKSAWLSALRRSGVIIRWQFYPERSRPDKLHHRSSIPFSLS